MQQDTYKFSKHALGMRYSKLQKETSTKENKPQILKEKLALGIIDLQFVINVVLNLFFTSS
jgi:hypothetical protein